MPQENTRERARFTADHPDEKTDKTSKDKNTSLEETSHIFEQRHWVNEACGDDLWDL